VTNEKTIEQGETIERAIKAFDARMLRAVAGAHPTAFRVGDWVQVDDPEFVRHGQEGAICAVAKTMPTCVWVRFDDDPENTCQIHTDNLRHMTDAREDAQ
jgi:hypothetical protein